MALLEDLMVLISHTDLIGSSVRGLSESYLTENFSKVLINIYKIDRKSSNFKNNRKI